MNSLSRRSFLAGASSLGLCALLPVSYSLAANRGTLKVPKGIQLWAVNEAMQTDAAGTLATLRKMGYQEVESAGFGALSAAQFRQLLATSGLTCPSAHLNFISGELDALLEDARTLGAQFAVSSMLEFGTGAQSDPTSPADSFVSKLRALTVDDAKRIAERANRIGARARQAGVQYAYHNHFFEFVPDTDGRIAYDVLLQETDPELVKFELDCGWMKVAGYDPVEYLRKYPGRFPMLHVKDFIAAPNAAVLPTQRESVELGRGYIDYRPIVAAATAAGLQHCFVEQEAPFKRMSQLEAAKVNYAYLQSLSR